MVNLNTLKQIRQQIYACSERSADALFELSDALSSEATARSLPELSLSPFFRRTWASVYEALEDGRIDEQRWMSVWTTALLAGHDGAVWISIDSTAIARPEAGPSPDRGMIYVPNLPPATKPVSVGWQFSTVISCPISPAVGEPSSPSGAFPVRRRRSRWALSNWSRCVPCFRDRPDCWPTAGMRPGSSSRRVSACVCQP